MNRLCEQVAERFALADAQPQANVNLDAELRRHIEICPECAGLSELPALLTVATGHSIEPGPGFRSRMMAGANARLHKRRSLRMGYAAAFACAAAVAIIGLSSQLSGASRGQEPLALAEQPSLTEGNQAQALKDDTDLNMTAPALETSELAALADVDSALSYQANWNAAGGNVDARDLARAADELGLSAEQRAALKKIVADSQRQSASIAAEIEQANTDLRAELDKPAPSRVRVEKLIDRVSSLEAKARKTRVLGWLKARELLTDPQEQALSELSGHRHAPDGMEEHVHVPPPPAPPAPTPPGPMPPAPPVLPEPPVVPEINIDPDIDIEPAMQEALRELENLDIDVDIDVDLGELERAFDDLDNMDWDSIEGMRGQPGMPEEVREELRKARQELRRELKNVDREAIRRALEEGKAERKRALKEAKRARGEAMRAMRQALEQARAAREAQRGLDDAEEASRAGHPGPEAEEAQRELEEARRQVEESQREAEEAAREAAKEIEEAMREAAEEIKEAQREAMRGAEEARRGAQGARREAMRQAEAARRDAERARQDVERARQDAERARLEARAEAERARREGKRGPARTDEDADTDQPAKGVVELIVPRGAEVLVDSTRVGPGTTTLELAPGKYKIEVKRPDGSKYKQTVIVEPGQRVNLVIGSDRL